MLRRKWYVTFYSINVSIMKLEIHSQMNIQIIRKHENINFDIITSSLLSSFFVLSYILHIIVLPQTQISIYY